jgi:hypothetical protein
MFDDTEEVEDTAENTVAAVRDRSLARATDGAWHDENRLRRDILILLARIDELERGAADTEMTVATGEPVGAERCKACGELFTALEGRMTWTVTDWVIPQIIGPIHARCQKRTAAQEDALAKVLAAARAAHPEEPQHG